MKRISLLLLIPLMLLCQGCPDNGVKFVKKVYLIRGTTQKDTLQVPASCGKFNSGVKVNIDAMVNYAKQNPEFKASYEKILLISEFSDRLRAITTAQCKIEQNSLVIDPTISDFSFYNDIVKNYLEYQKVRDLLTSNPSDSQKSKITKAILSVYDAIYNNKKDELLDYINNLVISVGVRPGTQVKVFKNNELIGNFVGSSQSTTDYVINKKYLLPEPGENISLKFVATTIGYGRVEKSYSLGELQKLKSTTGKISIDLKSE